MTQEEFDGTPFKDGMYFAEYGNVHELYGVDFELRALMDEAGNWYNFSICDMVNQNAQD